MRWFGYELVVGTRWSGYDLVRVRVDKHPLQTVVSKANKILGMIKQNFTDRTKETILPFYKGW